MHAQDLAMPLPGRYPIEMDSYIYSQKYIIRMFTAALFVIVQNWRLSKIE